MFHAVTTRLITIAAASFAGATLAAAGDGVASGHEIIQRFIDVSGGREAYAKIQNRAILAKLDLPDHGWKGELAELFVPPDYRRVIVIDTFDPIVTGVNGGSPWQRNPLGQGEAMGEAKAADAKRHAQLNPFLDWESAPGEAKVVGDANIKGDECYRVEVVPPDGPTVFAFFSKETGLLRRIDDSEANMFRYFDDYRERDGVLIPYKVRIDAGMMMLDLEFIRIEQNVDLRKLSAEDLFQTIDRERIAELLDVTEDGSLREPSD